MKILSIVCSAAILVALALTPTIAQEATAQQSERFINLRG